MLLDVSERLDRWVAEQNLHARAEGLPRVPACTIRVLGQTALLERSLVLTLASTKDVDVKADYVDSVRREFERLLAERGRLLDPLGHEVWMPRETKYEPLFTGNWVRVILADAESVLLSKALKAPAKNANLITEYLARGASDRFLKLAQKYSLDLEPFL